MTTRKVWRSAKAGDISRLALEEETLDDVAANEIRVSTRAIGLNFADIFALAGMYSATPAGAFIPGLEFSGEVSAVGKDVTSCAPGDRLMGVTRFGGYASQIDVEPNYCQALPDNWSFSQGAAYPVQTLTAWYALKALGAVEPGQNVLIQSAAGGVGLQALRICSKLSVNAYGTVGSAEKVEFLRKLGFEQIVVRDPSFPKNLIAQLGEHKLDLVLDAVGGKIQKQCFDLLAPAGRLVVFGAAEFAPGKKRPNYLKTLIRYLRRPLYDPLTLINDNKSVMGFNLIWLWNKQQLLNSAISELSSLELPPPHVGKEYSFEQALSAVEHLRSGKSVGKVVLTC